MTKTITHIKIHRPFPFAIAVLFGIISILLFIKIILVMNETHYTSESTIFTVLFDIIDELMFFFEQLIRAGFYLVLCSFTFIITLVSFVFSIQPRKKRIKEDWEY